MPKDTLAPGGTEDAVRLMRWKFSPGKESKPFFAQRRELLARVTLVIPYVAFGAGYFLLRSLAFQSVDRSLSKIAAISEQSGPSLIEQAETGLTALGFYFKKAIIPVPLNFAIDTVSSFYLWVGVLAVAGLCIVMFKTIL